jgi:RNA polymerase sigma-70 factor, ECF subfamily
LESNLSRARWRYSPTKDMRPSTPLANVVPLRPAAPGLSGRSDDELILLARAGRREAFDNLVTRHQQAALMLARRYLGDAARARDAAQNAFIELFRSLHVYRPRGRFPFFLSCLVLTQCRHFERAGRAWAKAQKRLETQPPVARPDVPDEVLLAREREWELQLALQHLSRRLREVVLLRYAGGHSLEEVSDILRIPVGTVKSRLFAAFRKLRASMRGP